MSLETMIDDYKTSFNLVTSEDGDKLIEWTKNNLHNFTTKKLADILSLAETFDDFFREEFVEKVEIELSNRNVGSSYLAPLN